MKTRETSYSPSPTTIANIKVAHGSIMGGPMGIKRTADKIQGAFDGQVSREM